MTLREYRNAVNLGMLIAITLQMRLPNYEALRDEYLEKMRELEGKEGLNK